MSDKFTDDMQTLVNKARMFDTLQAELHRCRTEENYAAVALDNVLPIITHMTEVLREAQTMGEVLGDIIVDNPKLGDLIPGLGGLRLRIGLAIQTAETRGLSPYPS